MHRIIIWLRNDLRLHDNPVLHWAASQTKLKHKEVIPVFSFDPRFYSTTETPMHPLYRTRKTGIHRARFAMDSVQAFRADLKKIGSGLMVTSQKPEDFLHTLLEPSMTNTVVYQQEHMAEELAIEKTVRERLTSTLPETQFLSIWGSTLHHIDDLPYDPNTYAPHAYGYFRKKHADVQVRALLPTPEEGQLPFIEPKTDHLQKSLSFMPCLHGDFGFSHEEVKATEDPDSRMYYKWKGGEQAALKRME
jgi:deoxyribodipyrimidine photo-lyase